RKRCGWFNIHSACTQLFSCSIHIWKEKSAKVMILKVRSYNTPSLVQSSLIDRIHHRFTADHNNLRFFVELLVDGWLAGVYDLEAHKWLWTENVSDPHEGKRLILERQGIDPQEIIWNEYQPLPTSEN